MRVIVIYLVLIILHSVPHIKASIFLPALAQAFEDRVRLHHYALYGQLHIPNFERFDSEARTH